MKSKRGSFADVMKQARYHQEVVKAWKDLSKSSTNPDEQAFYHSIIQYHNDRANELMTYAKTLRVPIKRTCSNESMML